MLQKVNYPKSHSLNTLTKKELTESVSFLIIEIFIIARRLTVYCVAMKNKVSFKAIIVFSSHFYLTSDVDEQHFVFRFRDLVACLKLCCVEASQP